MQSGVRSVTRPGVMRLLATGLAIALAASACVAAQKTPRIIYVTPTPAPSPTATPSPSPASPGPSGSGAKPSSVATPAGPTATVSSTTVTSHASDNRWTSKFEKPVVSGIASAATMNTSITNRISAYISAFTSSGLPAVASGDGPSTLEGKFSVAYVSPTLLSLRFSVATYVTGAAHPVTEIGSLNFEVASGKVIQLPDIFANPASALPVLSSKAHTALSAKLGADLKWPASVTIAFFGKAWVFTQTSLELGWQQGEIASMAAGAPTIAIPWSGLKTVLANPGPAAGFIA